MGCELCKKEAREFFKGALETKTSTEEELDEAVEAATQEWYAGQKPGADLKVATESNRGAGINHIGKMTSNTQYLKKKQMKIYLRVIKQRIQTNHYISKE